MAEILGLISSIGTIAAAGFKISRAIAAVWDHFGAASASVQAIASDISMVTMILSQLRDRLSARRKMDSATTEILQHIVSQCKAELGELETALLPLLANVKAGKPMSTRQKLRWLFAKSKICSQQAALGSLKLTLSLFVHTIQLSDGYNVEGLKEEILDAISQTKDTKTAFLNAERVDHAVAAAFDAKADDGGRSDAQEDTGGVSSPPTNPSKTQTSGGESLVLSLLSTGRLTSKIDGGLLSATSLQPFKMSELDIVQNLTDDSFIRIATHLELEKSVTTFALAALSRQPTQDTEATSDGSAELITEDTDSDDTSVAANLCSYRSSPARSPVRPQKDRRDSGTRRRPAHVGNRRRNYDAGKHKSEWRDNANGVAGSERLFDVPQPPPSRFGSRKMDYTAELSDFDDYFARDRRETSQGDSNDETAPGYLPQNARRQSSFGARPPQFPNRSSQPAYDKYTMQAQSTKDRDAELEELRAQLARLQEQERKKREAEELAELKHRIHREAEATLQRRLEEMQRAQEEAKRSIERARSEIERAAREKLEAEIKAEQERQRQREEEIRRIEREAREKLEGEIRAAEEQKLREKQLELQRLEEELRSRKSERGSRRILGALKLR